jgi:hypothetical protein
MSFFILLFVGVMLWGAFISSRFEWMAADTPTVPTGSPIVGQLEIIGSAGVAPSKEIIVSPLSGTRCVWWSFSVYRYVKNSKGERTRQSLHSGLSMPWLTLNDGSGPCEVRFGTHAPENASRNEYKPAEIPAGLTVAQLAVFGVDRKDTMPGLDDKAAKWIDRFTTTLEELGARKDVPIAELDGGYCVEETYVEEGQSMYALG